MAPPARLLEMGVKTLRRSDDRVDPAAAHRGGISSRPPSYGIDFADRHDHSGVPVLHDEMERARAEGRPLGSAIRRSLEAAMGADFGAVRISTGERADRLNRAFGARAFTSKGDIFFRSGGFAPYSLGGRELLAHELTHVVQQDRSGGAASVQMSADEDLHRGGSLARLSTPNPTLPAPPATAGPQPGPAAFAPLSAADLAARRTLGVSTDTGTMTAELYTTLSPTGGSAACNPQPATFEPTVAAAISTALRADLPTTTPATAPDPMTLASQVADEAMPIIHTYYAPHAPSRSPASFMAIARRTPPSYGDLIRTDDSALGEFLQWYAGARNSVRAVTGDKCGMTRAWWDAFATWVRGSPYNSAPHEIPERAAVYDTFLTTITNAPSLVQFGRGFALSSIPHTVVHESMHLFQHPDLSDQSGFLQSRSIGDIFIEGFAEYLARGVRDRVVTAIQARVPPALSPADAAVARTRRGYDFYVGKAVELRDTLYRHGQDGEEAIRRAFFLGEGWRFALLENVGTAAAPVAGPSSPIETDRPVPPDADVRFASNSNTIIDPTPLAAIVAYVMTRSVARVEVTGRTDPEGSDADNLALGTDRADAVKAYLVGRGIPAGRITTSSRGEQDQIAGGHAVNRRATVKVVDPRNLAPGEPALGR